MAGQQDPDVTFVIAEGSYAAAVGGLRTRLRIHSRNGDVEGQPILADQLTRVPIPPGRLIRLRIVAPFGASTTILIRDDNAFVVGFINNQGNKFELEKHGVNRNLITDATPIGFDGNYVSLIGGSNNIPTLNLGRHTIIDATMKLANYTHRAAAATADDDDPEAKTATREIKEAVAHLVVALCEGARLLPVFDAINVNWDEYNPAYIPAADVLLINNWGHLSSALLGTNSYGDKFAWPANLVEIGITDKAKGLSVICLILNKMPARPPFIFVDYVKNMWKLLRRLFGFTIPTV